MTPDLVILTGGSSWPTVLVAGAVGTLGVVLGGWITHWTTTQRDTATRRYEALADFSSRLRGSAIAIEYAIGYAISPSTGKTPDRDPVGFARHLVGEALWRRAGIELLFPETHPVAKRAESAVECLNAALLEVEAWNGAPSRAQEATARERLNVAEKAINDYNANARGELGRVMPTAGKSAAG